MISWVSQFLSSGWWQNIMVGGYRIKNLLPHGGQEAEGLSGWEHRKDTPQRQSTDNLFS